MIHCSRCFLTLTEYPDCPSALYDDIWTGGHVLFCQCGCHGQRKDESAVPVSEVSEMTAISIAAKRKTGLTGHH
ncbi:hypothetical protein FJZ26_03205 [Candidatus Parvarchaeota archaeon]|nr:hypothetical protein [Candidatus Parvarchaeota archaeon]